MIDTNKLWQFEDDMDEYGIFGSGCDGRIMSRESYGTVMDFDKMDEFLFYRKDDYTPEEWQELHRSFDGIGYLSPMNGLVACMIKRKILDNIK